MKLFTIQNQIEILKAQREKVSSDPDLTRRREKTKFIEGMIDTLEMAAAEITRLRRYTHALSNRNDELNQMLQDSERNHQATKKQNNRFSHLLATAGLPPYSLSR